MVTRNSTDFTTKSDADKHELLSPLLDAMAADFQELAKKKSDGVVSASKVKMVNRLLADIHVLLKNEPTIAYLDLLDEDDLPQNSDVMLVLSQVRAAMGAFRARYYGWDGRTHKWFVNG